VAFGNLLRQRLNHQFLSKSTFRDSFKLYMIGTKSAILRELNYGQKFAPTPGFLRQDCFPVSRAAASHLTVVHSHKC
jgi:hypothetical protein